MRECDIHCGIRLCPMNYLLDLERQLFVICEFVEDLFCVDHLEICSRIFNKNIVNSCLGQTLLEIATEEYPWKQFDRAAHLKPSLENEVNEKVRVNQSMWFLLGIS